MKKKTILIIAVALTAIIGLGAGFVLADTPPDRPAAPAASSIAEMDSSSTLPAPDAPESTGTDEAALPPAESEYLDGNHFMEYEEENGQGEGLDISDEITPSTEDGTTGTTWQVGDEIVHEDGSVGVVVDWDKEDEEWWETITPEELQEVRDMNLNFG